MHWLIQRKFEYDNNYKKLIYNLERLGIPHSYCKVIPFSENGIEWEGEAPPEGTKCFASGSYTLAKIAKKYYSPGGFISERLDMPALVENWKDEMFNNDMVFTTLRNVVLEEGEIAFIRPVADSKSFSGQVISAGELQDWVKKLTVLEQEGGFSTLTLDTSVCISSIKPIDYEIRFFIVNGKPVTWSEYKRGGNVAYKEDVEQYIIDYVAGLVGNPDFCLGAYQPEPAYVLDVAVTDGVPKILEANSINAVGLYAADTQKLIMAIEDLEYYL